MMMEARFLCVSDKNLLVILENRASIIVQRTPVVYIIKKHAKNLPLLLFVVSKKVEKSLIKVEPEPTNTEGGTTRNK
jgi:hypothetical protein